MAFCKSGGFPAYSTVDLHAYGFIPKKLVFQYDQGDEPTERERSNLRTGQSFKQIALTDDTGKPVLDKDGKTILVWIDARVILPATQIQVDFVFRSRTKSSNVSLGSLGDLGGIGALGAGTGMIAVDIANTTFLGGVSQSRNQQCWNLLSSNTKINFAVTVDDTVRKAEGVIALPGYVVAILGAFQEPLVLSDAQKKRIGDMLNPPRSALGYIGDVDEQGVFDGGLIDGASFYAAKNVPPIFPPTVTKSSRQVFEEKNLLLEVLKDTRLNAYRADNEDYSPQPNAKQFDTLNFNDVQSNKIKIDLTPFKDKDGTVFITVCLASRRIFREFNYHEATFAETGDRVGGVTSEILPIKTEVSTWHYQAVKWRTKKITALESAKQKTINSDYLKSIMVGMEVFSTVSEALAEDKRTWDTVEGWRLSEDISPSALKMYCADKNGIHLVERADSGLSVIEGNNAVKSTLLIPSASIVDQAWWVKFLQDNLLTDFDLTKQGVPEREFAGLMYDISIHNNTCLPDAKKVGYQRRLALALSDVTSGVGVPNLDLLVNKILGSSGYDQRFDLNSAVFKSTGARSYFPTAWFASPCYGINDRGTYYDPTDPLNTFNFFNNIGKGDFMTDWIMSTPSYSGSFDSSTRIQVEMFQPNGGNLNPSGIFVTTLPNPESSISLDHTSSHDESFLFFDNPNYDSLAFYRFSSGYTQRMLNRLFLYPQGNHDKGVYDYARFGYVGYSLSAGQLPDYSVGSLIGKEKIEVCSNKIKWSDIYQDVVFTVPTLSSNTYEISSDDIRMFKQLEIEVEVSEDFVMAGFDGSDKLLSSANVTLFGGTPISAGSFIDDSNRMSIYFRSSNQVIENIFLPTRKGKHSFVIDCNFYGGNPIVFQSDFFKYCKILSVKGLYTTKDKIQNYLIAGSQTATAIDGKNRIHIFYHDVGTKNINCAVSGDYGRSWWVFRDILWLEDGETAEQPYVICDKYSSEVYLYYKLNGRFLMVKRFATSLFACDDQFVVYKPPQSGEIAKLEREVITSLKSLSQDSLIELDEVLSTNKTPIGKVKEIDDKLNGKLGLGSYTSLGRQLRQEVSWFVHGNADDSFFKDCVKLQNDIAKARQDFGIKLPVRFAFAGDANGIEAQHMDSDFEGKFCAYYDNRGKFRTVFTNGDGRISWKTNGGDVSNWYYDVRGEYIHKDFFADDPDQKDLSIDNPQIVYDALNDDVWLFYFHRSGLYVRRFDNAMLYPDKAGGTELPQNEDEGFVTNDRIKKHIEIATDSTSLPIFLVGLLDTEMIAGIAKDENVAKDKREVSIDFRYDKPENFSEKYPVDIGSKTVGYAMRNGLIRLFYRSEHGDVLGLTLNGGMPSLDCRKRLGKNNP